MGAGEDAVEIVQVQFIGQVLNVHCYLHTDSFFSEEVDAGREIQNRSGLDSPTLEIYFIKESRIESLTRKFLKRRSGFYVDRNA